MEAVKSIIWQKGTSVVQGKKVHRYLIGMVLVTDQEIDIPAGDVVAMSEDPTDLNAFTNTLDAMRKFSSPHILGDLSNAIIDVSEMNPQDLDPIVKDEGRSHHRVKD